MPRSILCADSADQFVDAGDFLRQRPGADQPPITQGISNRRNACSARVLVGEKGR